MSVFFSEFRKLLGSRQIVLIIAAAVIINVMLLVIPEYTEHSPAVYNTLWDKLDALPASERAEYVRSRITDWTDPRYFSQTADFYEEQDILNDILVEIEQVNSYADYLKSVDNAAENMKAMSFFADENSFNYCNIIKTQDDFSNLGTENIIPERSNGVIMAVRFGTSDILMMLLVLIFTAKLIISEREQGYLPLIRTTANGHLRLSIAKLLALTLSSCIAAVVVYGSNIVCGAAVYGLGDLDRGIQSVYGFFSCGETIGVGAFLIKYMLTKLLFCVSLSAIVFMFSVLPVGSAAEYALIFAFSAGETALYYSIPATSVFAPLRQINLTAAADSAVLIGKYLNVNFFGSPINAAIAAVIASLIFTGACGIAGILILSGKLFERKRSVKKVIFSGKTTSLTANELYKSLIGGKAVLILPAAAVVMLLQNPIKPYYSDISDYIYYSYISDIQGEYSEEKKEYIDSELQAASLDFSEQGMIKLTALDQLQRHAEYLSENGGQFVMDVGYKMLTGDDSVRVYDRFAAAVKTLVLIFIAGYSYSAEHSSKAIMLLRSAPNGKGRTFIWKMLVMALCSVLILAIFDGSRIINVLNTWGTELFTASAHSMEHLSTVSISIVSYVVITEIWRFVGMIIVSAAVFFISGRVKNYSVSVIFSVAVFVTPLVLSAIGFEFMDYFAATPLLIGNVIR